MRGRTLVSLTASIALVGAMTPTVLAQDALPEVRVAVWSGPEADNLRQVAEAYTSETGNPVTIEEIARDGYEDALRTSVVGGGGQPGYADRYRYLLNCFPQLAELWHRFR